MHTVSQEKGTALHHIKIKLLICLVSLDFTSPLFRFCTNCKPTTLQIFSTRLSTSLVKMSDYPRSNWASRLGVPYKVFQTWDDRQKKKGQTHCSRHGVLHPELAKHPSLPDSLRNTQPLVPASFKGCWAEKLGIPFEVYRLWDHKQKDKGSWYFRTHNKHLHPELAKADGVPARLQGAPPIRQGRPPIGRWSQLRAENLGASEGALRRLYNAELRARSRVDAHISTSCVINVAALKKWLVDPDNKHQACARRLLDLAERIPGPSEHKRIVHEHWQRHGVGRLFAEPWASLASVDRKSRAVALFGFLVWDFDLENAHPRISEHIYRAARAGLPHVDKLLAPLTELLTDRERILAEQKAGHNTSRGAIKTLLVALLNGGGIYPDRWLADSCADPVEGQLREYLERFKSCVTAIKNSCLEASLNPENESIPRLPKEFINDVGLAKDPKRYWSFLLAVFENRALMAIYATAIFMGCEVWSFQYDGLMAGPANPSMLDSLGLSQAEFSEYIAKTASLVVSYTTGMNLPVKVKRLPLPALFEEVETLNAENEALVAENGELAAENEKLAAQMDAQNEKQAAVIVEKNALIDELAAGIADKDALIASLMTQLQQLRG